MANKTDDAYTANRAGRRGLRGSRTLIELRNAVSVGEGFHAYRTQHKSIRDESTATAEATRECKGVKDRRNCGMYEEACTRTWEAPEIVSFFYEERT